jgi:hypothetical protein
MISMLKQLIVASLIAIAFANPAPAAPTRPVSHSSYHWMEQDAGGKPLTL